MEACRTTVPELVKMSDDHEVACLLYREKSGGEGS
jgi:hypothetical protein